MEKVYLLIALYTFESATETEVEVFGTREKALARFREVLTNEKQDSWLNELDGVHIDTEDYERGKFDAWVDGRASEFMTTIYIKEEEVK